MLVHFAFMFNAIDILYVICMSGFDDMWCMCDAMYCMLGVFDSIRLLGVRVGNLNELSKR